MFVAIHSAAIVGIDALEVTVEVNITTGSIGLQLVGLPDNAVKESEQRIRSAFDCIGERIVARNVVVNLAPAALRKEGSAFDLPIAVGILAAMEHVPTDKIEGTMFAGELSLDGTVRSVPGVLSMAVLARKSGLTRMVVPVENASEAAVVDGLEVIPVQNLKTLIDWMTGTTEIGPFVATRNRELDYTPGLYDEDFVDVKGQEVVKRAMEIAAAGGHNVLLIGSPGSGKTMLARRLPTILPPLTREEALETTKIHSVAGQKSGHEGLMIRRPFRTPHHLTSQAAIVGGGQTPRPGEVSLAHNGVLFLDELPEFGRNVLEVLRQPLEDKRITVSRARYSVEYPANFMLVAAMNPCPCGYYNHPTRECTCAPGAVQRYMSRISGPLMDRIDLHVEVTPVPPSILSNLQPGEPSSEVRKRVIRAREIQAERFRDVPGVYTNAMMNASLLRTYCQMDRETAAMLEQAMVRLSLSARAYDRILKVARTIADLAGHEAITRADVAEAITYRSLDRGSWGRTF